ncbi:MAG: acyloxyacyl hydrolase [Terriglobales bacterium]
MGQCFRVAVCSLIVCVVSSLAVAQELGAGALKKGATEINLWVGGGSGLGESSDFQMLNAGVRLGKVLTGSHGPGFLRGNLEYAADLVPLYLFVQDRVVAPGATDRQTVYGGSISPLILKWNFTSGKRIAPYIALEESAIFTTDDVPAGDTSTINFASGFGSGLQFFRGDNHALSLSGHLMHISNASIGNHNPSINIALQFRLGYQWWK